MHRSKSPIQKKISGQSKRSVKMDDEDVLRRPVSIRIIQLPSRLTVLDALYFSPRWVLPCSEIAGQEKVSVKLKLGRRVVAVGELTGLDDEDGKVGLRITEVRPPRAWWPKRSKRGGHQ